MSWFTMPASLAVGLFKGFGKYLGILFIIAAPPWLVVALCNDLPHPETWDRGGTHDPRVYMPVLVMGLVLGMALFSRTWVDQQRTKR